MLLAVVLALLAVLRQVSKSHCLFGPAPQPRWRALLLVLPLLLILPLLLLLCCSCSKL